MPSDPTAGLAAAVSRFGEQTTRRLSNPAVTGEPEDQLRGPLEVLIGDLAELCRLTRSAVSTVGEASLADLKTRPDYAVTVHNALNGFVEVKAPGKGADPRRFRDQHDKEQWSKLKALPNLLYTDGNEFAVWHNGELSGSIVRLEGDVSTSGRGLIAPPSLLAVFEDFLRWQPNPPRSVKELAETSARLCRLLRDEVTEQLGLRSPALTDLAEDWRRLLFPDASDATFADGYAQAVTFGLLMARAREIELTPELEGVARELTQTESLIGTALKLLTDSVENQRTLQTSLGTLIRVLNSVSWAALSRGRPDAWLYFYEDFLEVYDNKLRKQTGSYYTPPEVVDSMVRLVDECLRTRFGLALGLASRNVTIADPAAGTGTFILGLLRRIAKTVEADQGAGAVPAAIAAKMRQLIAFELQLGPFAVAQLRVVAELTELTGAPPTTPFRMFVTNTLANPYAEQEYMPAMFRPIAESSREASRIKREEPITVVIGNPPYKEKAKGKGGWIEFNSDRMVVPPLQAWIPPQAWGVGAHAKHLRNLYVYFWRWATWKVFDHHPESNQGIVTFITAAGFLTGPGFGKMRDYFRRTCDDIWIIDCSPEGHRPDVNTRIFQGVQQPICIMIASRSGQSNGDTPARIRYSALPLGHRREKLATLARLPLEGAMWQDCSPEWRASFAPAAIGAWKSYPALDALFDYNGSGVMPGRTWVIAPDSESLVARWGVLTSSPEDAKARLFHPHLRGGLDGDRYVAKTGVAALPGRPERRIAVSSDTGPVVVPQPYAFRSFDRQWIIPDNRLINQANPNLWASYSQAQVFLTAPADTPATAGPALTFTDLIPDLHHYNGRGGRVFPLWADADARSSNVSAGVLRALEAYLGHELAPVDVVGYIAAISAHSGYTRRFAMDLHQPGLRMPITTDSDLFQRAVGIGREVIWLHTYGERCADVTGGRPAGPPRLPSNRAPRIPSDGPIPMTMDGMPDTIDYDPLARMMRVGTGVVENISPEVWNYEVSGKQVIRQWFSYRKRNRERPIIGDRRPPSPLGSVQPDHWLAEYTTDLLNLLHVLGRLVDLEPAQADLLEQVCVGPTLTADEVAAAAAEGLLTAAPTGRKRRTAQQPRLL